MALILSFLCIRFYVKYLYIFTKLWNGKERFLSNYFRFFCDVILIIIKIQNYIKNKKYRENILCYSAYDMYVFLEQVNVFIKKANKIKVK